MLEDQSITEMSSPTLSSIIVRARKRRGDSTKHKPRRQIATTPYQHHQQNMTFSRVDEHTRITIGDSSANDETVKKSRAMGLDVGLDSENSKSEPLLSGGDSRDVSAIEIGS